MKLTLWLCLLPLAGSLMQTLDLGQIRLLYQRAPVAKQAAAQLNAFMLRVDTGAADPVIICYKGANEMIQAKYNMNPLTKLGKFNEGKNLISIAFSKDTLNLEYDLSAILSKVIYPLFSVTTMIFRRTKAFC